MARPLRIEFPGAVYHITSRGNEQKDVFRDNKDRTIFLDILARSCNLFKWLRDTAVKEAIEVHGYSQKGIADHLELHYSTIN